ncbi:hypothetical protein OEA41_006307 [Lepraria neglecta]|uniref:Uncharacterized protein n=1 Tax=Lepraria neglecta TaxID=209136 RepID=A0AAD9Z7D6_9LECA|nr:hypothetical protein OEA41_006307 [Lepraria neglecta]
MDMWAAVPSQKANLNANILFQMLGEMGASVRYLTAARLNQELLFLTMELQISMSGPETGVWNDEMFHCLESLRGQNLNIQNLRVQKNRGPTTLSLTGQTLSQILGGLRHLSLNCQIPHAPNLSLRSLSQTPYQPTDHYQTQLQGSIHCYCEHLLRQEGKKYQLRRAQMW